MSTVPYLPASHDEPLHPDLTRTVLAEVFDERARQDAKWGQQDHPNGTGPDLAWGILGPASEVADEARRRCQQDAAEGRATFAGIALEEFAEAMAESDPDRLRTELVQNAAVFVQWVERIDRLAADRHPGYPPSRPRTVEQPARAVAPASDDDRDDDPAPPEPFAEHQPVIEYPSGTAQVCQRCGEEWPCEHARYRAELAALRAKSDAAALDLRFARSRADRLEKQRDEWRYATDHAGEVIGELSRERGELQDKLTAERAAHQATRDAAQKVYGELCRDPERAGHVATEPTEEA